MKLGTSKLGIKSGTKEYRQLYYKLNKKRQQHLSKIWYETHKEQRLASCRAWRKANHTRNRLNQVKRLYGLSGEEYTAMLLSQGGNCKLCKKPLIKPVVEHNHLTNEIRGITCSRCNWLISAYEITKHTLPEGTIELYLGLNKDINGI